MALIDFVSGAASRSRRQLMYLSLPIGIGGWLLSISLGFAGGSRDWLLIATGATATLTLVMLLCALATSFRLEREAADLAGTAQALRRANAEAEAARAEAEAARRLADETSRHLLEAQRIGKLGHWFTDEVARTVTWSPQMFEITGWEPQPTLSLDLSRLPPVHPEDASEFLAVRTRAVATGETQTTEVRFVRPDGGVRWVHIEMQARYDQTGSVSHLFGTSQDITERRQAEDALKATRQQLIDAIESISEGFVLFDRDDRFVLTNSNYTRMFPFLGETIAPGTPYLEFLKASLASGLIVHGHEDPERWLQKKLEWHRACAEAREFRFTDGRWISSVERRTSDGGIVGIRIDITERKRAEEALAAAQARLIDAIESMSDGFALFDRDDCYVMTNSNYRQLYADRTDLFQPGTRYEDMLRGSIERGRDIGGQDPERWVHNLVKWHRACREPLERQGPDGRWIRCVERRTSDGGIVGIRTDITAMKNAETALVRKVEDLEAMQQRLEKMSHELAQSEARFRDFALTSSHWLWETDAEHRFAFVSEGVKTFGFSTESLIGRTRLQIAVDAGSNTEKWRSFQAALDNREPFRDYVYRWKNDGGGEGVASVSGDPFFDAQGRFLGYRGTGRDITEQVLAEDALREAKRAAEAASVAKSQFLANMSHELRTPLNAIIGFSQMIELCIKGPLPESYREYGRLIRQSGKHLQEVINDILDLAKVDSGKFQLRQEAGVDPCRIAEGCIELVREHAQAGDIRLTLNIIDRPPLLFADPTRLKQVLLNLLSNAIKFTRPGGSVIVIARRSEDGAAVFEVRDNGIGMTASEVEIALQPFAQVDAHSDRRHEGTGLGLPLARRLAELHGGSLSIVSQKGSGTTVIVTLPAPSPKEAVSETLAHAAG